MARVPSVVVFSRLAAKARLRHLQLLVAISDLGNLQKAAAAVGMSQPAATHALSELESLVEAKLFDRHSRGMRPTVLTTALIPLLKNAMRSLQQCADLVSATGLGANSSLRIGAIGAAVSGVLPHVLASYSESHPEVLIDVVQMTPELLAPAVSDETLDIALCRRPGLLPEACEFVPLLRDRYAVVCSANHPLAGKRVNGLNALVRYAWLMPPQSGIAGAEFARFWDSEGRRPEVCWVTSRLPMVMWSMLERRPLLSLAPFNVVKQFLEAGIMAEVHGPWDMSIGPVGAVVRRADAGSSGVVHSFLADLLALSDGEPEES